MFVVYKLPTVVISRRTDQYSKAFESLMGQQPWQGIPKARSGTLTRAASGGPALQAYPHPFFLTVSQLALCAVSICHMQLNTT